MGGGYSDPEIQFDGATCDSNSEPRCENLTDLNAGTVIFNITHWKAGGSVQIAESSPAGDTCDCAGLNNNWEVDMSDYCFITDNCDLGTGTLSFINTGNFTVQAIIDTTSVGALSDDQVI